MPSFSVVCYMKESRSIVQRFINYYKKLGADHIQLFVDGSACHVIDLADQTVTITECNQAFWASLQRSRPTGLEEAQHATYMLGYKAAETDWVIIVDSDEFIFGPLEMSRVLAGVPSEIEAVIFPSAEAVWLPHDVDKYTDFSSTGFRTLTKGSGIWLSRFLYSPKLWPGLRKGILSHLGGKQALRTGYNFTEIRCHRSFYGEKIVGTYVGAINPQFANMYLGHFDAIGYTRWKSKWKSRLEGRTIANRMGKRRRAQFEMVRNANAKGEEALKTLYLRSFSLTKFQWFVLRKKGLAFQKDIFADTVVGDAIEKGN
ncbi:MAG: glycosyltransferase family 2 protein [Marinosulfonomonas sp.]